MDFKKLLGNEMIAAILGAAIVALLEKITDLSYAVLIWLVPILVVLVFLAQLKHRLQIWRSGLAGYFKTLTFTEGYDYWKKAQNSFAYLGVSGSSILEQLKVFMYHHPNPEMKYHLLLMDPTCKELREQIAFYKGYDPQNLSPEQQEKITELVAVEDQKLKATVAALKAMRSDDRPFRGLEIRLFAEFVPWWFYLIDEEKIVVGLLRKGQEVGGEQSAAILQKHKKNEITTLFTSFQENFQRIWRSAKPV